jgi:hypothetical protein
MSITLRPSIASSAPRLCRTHCRGSIFVDFDYVASRVCAGREASEPFRASEDDRMGLGAGLDHVALFDLLVEERVEADPPRALRIDLTHEREYRKSAGANAANAPCASKLPSQVGVAPASCRQDLAGRDPRADLLAGTAARIRAMGAVRLCVDRGAGRSRGSGRPL